MVHWSQQKRHYTVYRLYHPVQNSVYIGVTARPLKTRLKEHLRTGSASSPCALHRALGSLSVSQWSIRAIANVDGPLHAARKVERDHVRRLRRRGHATVLNADARFGYNACHPVNTH